MLVPVPLGAERLRARGFNQAALLARELARLIDVPVEERALRRVRETRSQVGLGPEERQRNVAEAFVAVGDLVLDESPLIIDDLTTTGATMSACARALRSAGAVAVHGLAVAKAS